MTSDLTQIIVEQDLPRERLDRFLGDQFPSVSRSTIRRLIDEGEIQVNGNPVKPTHHPRAGEQITVHWPPPRPAEVVAKDIPLGVLYEDDDLLVINKPPDMIVHPASGDEEDTLVNALLHHCRGQLSGIGGVARPGIVHRLDKETSGCLVVAKNDPTHVALAGQFAERRVEKIYQAIVIGEVLNAAGEIRVPIARHCSHRKRMTATDGRGKEAWTSYRVVKRLNAATHVEVSLHTGRTHQIRVHFQHLGYPLVGDLLYGKRQNGRLTELTGYTAPRVMLHAQRLAFTHPASGERMAFTTPLPADFLATLAALEKTTG